MNRGIEVIFPVLVLSLVVLSLSAHPLIDPDLGWNLAGGLWILDNFSIPSLDPLAALASPWIDYCYLPQILFGIVYKLFDFEGLLALQLIIPTLMFVTTGLFIFQNFGGDNKKLSGRLLPVFLAATLVLFIAPIFHVRPQLFSVFLFLLFLVWRASSKNTLILLGILILWNNTHVYWIFAPVVLVADYLVGKAFPIKTNVSLNTVLISLLAPLISPYGIKNYLPIFQYSFFHSHVKDLIQEFQPLIFTEGYLLPVTVILFGSIFYFFRSGKIYVNDLALSTLFFLLALWQMKFTPVFGVFSIMALTKIDFGPGIRLAAPARIAVYGICLVLCILTSLFVSPTLGKNQEELLALGDAAAQVNGPVFTQFNTGGWIELGIYLSNRQSLAKPWIDGRTLVMGEKRLNDYFSVSIKQQSFEKYLDDNKIDYLILNKNSVLLPLIFPTKTNVEFETENYFLLSKSRISVSSS